MSTTPAPTLIKRYANRKLYDTDRSCYVTLEEIAELVRGGAEVRVMDNRTGDDLTTVTFAQIIFETEKKRKSMPLELLRDLVANGGGALVDITREHVTTVQSKALELRVAAQDTASEIRHTAAHCAEDVGDRALRLRDDLGNRVTRLITPESATQHAGPGAQRVSELVVSSQRALGRLQESLTANQDAGSTSPEVRTQLNDILGRLVDLQEQVTR